MSLEELVAVARWTERKWLSFVVMGEGANLYIAYISPPHLHYRRQYCWNARSPFG